MLTDKEIAKRYSGYYITEIPYDIYDIVLDYCDVVVALYYIKDDIITKLEEIPVDDELLLLNYLQKVRVSNNYYLSKKFVRFR